MAQTCNCGKDISIEGIEIIQYYRPNKSETVRWRMCEDCWNRLFAPKIISEVIR